LFDPCLAGGAFDFRYWHKADVLKALTNVRLLGAKRHGLTSAYQSRFMSTRPCKLVSEQNNGSVRSTSHFLARSEGHCELVCGSRFRYDMARIVPALPRAK